MSQLYGYCTQGQYRTYWKKSVFGFVFYCIFLILFAFLCDMCKIWIREKPRGDNPPPSTSPPRPPPLPLPPPPLPTAAVGGSARSWNRKNVFPARPVFKMKSSQKSQGANSVLQAGRGRTCNLSPSRYWIVALALWGAALSRSNDVLVIPTFGRCSSWTAATSFGSAVPVCV